MNHERHESDEKSQGHWPEIFRVFRDFRGYNRDSFLQEIAEDTEEVRRVYAFSTFGFRIVNPGVVLSSPRRRGSSALRVVLVSRLSGNDEPKNQMLTKLFPRKSEIYLTVLPGCVDTRLVFKRAS